MQAFVIYLNERPLEWSLDGETAVAVGRMIAPFYGFHDRADAESVLREVPSLFDLDDEDAETLQIVTIELPGPSDARAN